MRGSPNKNLVEKWCYTFIQEFDPSNLVLQKSALPQSCRAWNSPSIGFLFFFFRFSNRKVRCVKAEYHCLETLLFNKNGLSLQCFESWFLVCVNTIIRSLIKENKKTAFPNIWGCRRTKIKSRKAVFYVLSRIWPVKRGSIKKCSLTKL